MKPSLPALFAMMLCLGTARGGEKNPDRCELLPLPGRQVAFLLDGVEKTRWHFDSADPRPFFFPFNGPSGESLTRMGHPGAPNHDHHRSIWFAHAKVNGIDFWSENTRARIRQKEWLAYRDGPEEAIMAAAAGWQDADGAQILEQQTIASLLPLPGGATALEIQVTLQPAGTRENVVLEKSNFGLLAVRVAKSLSAHFGGGTIRNSEGAEGEEAIFGKAARWMDYSGPIATGTGAERRHVTEGIAFFDHPANPRYPTPWHVRSDGWMGASFCLNEGYTIEKSRPLVLRYQIVAHAGAYEAAWAEQTAGDFGKRPGFIVEKSTRPHLQYEVRRAGRPEAATDPAP